MLYKHTQMGYSLMGLMVVAALTAAVFHAVIFILIACVAGILFSTLTVSVNSNGVQLWFGPGFLPQRFALGDIESCEITKRRYGFLGIYGWPGKFWIFNVSGCHSVRLQMRNGMKYFIGTNQPETLVKSIREVMHEAVHLAIKID